MTLNTVNFAALIEKVKRDTLVDERLAQILKADFARSGVDIGYESAIESIRKRFDTKVLKSVLSEVKADDKG